MHRRFSDGSAAGWRDRVEALAAESDGADQVRIGAAIHSVRAVPDDQLAEVLRWAAGRPVHAHVSEQPAENEACLRHYGRTPTAAAGRARLRRSAAHRGARHPPDRGRHRLVRQSRTTVSFCPTTERDLADGIGPASALAAAGARLTLGSDQNATVDLLDEAQALELDDRLASLRRGRFSPAALVDSLTGAGHASLGWPTPAGSRWASGPTWWRSGWTPSGPPGCCRARR